MATCLEGRLAQAKQSAIHSCSASDCEAVTRQTEFPTMLPGTMMAEMAALGGHVSKAVRVQESPDH